MNSLNAPDLHCHSTFSTFDGMGTPEAVVLRAKELGWSGAALTEHGWCGSAPAFYQAARENGINPIIGCEFYVAPNLGVKTKEERSNVFHLTVLALSKEGYFNLVEWITAANDPDHFYYKPRISPEYMAEIAPFPLHHNVVLSGCLGSELSQAMVNLNGTWEDSGIAYIDAMNSLFPNFYLELQNHRIDKFYGAPAYGAYNDMVEKEKAVRKRLTQLAIDTGTPTVITNDSHFQSRKQWRAHLAYKASSFRHRDDTHHGASEEKLAELFLNDYVYMGSYMRSMEEVADGIELGKESLENAQAIADEAKIKLDPLDNFEYSIPFSGYDDPMQEIRDRSKSRLKRLIEKHGKVARDRYEKEINAMGDFAHYLLLLSRWIDEAHDQGILTWTRGSAANSIVCYCLGIHDLDSIEMKLTFERFVNPARKKLPDIDVDIEAGRYEDFMRIVQEDMEELEGSDQVVQICNYGTLANRSAFRMVADTLGMEKEQQDELAKLLPQMIDTGMVESDNEVYVSLKEDWPELYELVEKVFDSIKQVGQHPCGWILGTRDRPVKKWIPMFFIASSKRHVTAYNMGAIEKMGWVKGDFLRLDTLTIIRKVLTMIGQDPITGFAKIPLDDPETFKLLAEGRTEGIHSMQGNTQRRGCMEVRPQNIDEVIAVQALYRPSGTRTGLLKAYLKRRAGEEAWESPQGAEEILDETYGLPIFQEQVLDLAYLFGMDDAEVQELLDAIKKSKGTGRGAKELYQKVKPKFIKKASRKTTPEDAEEIWNLMDSGGGYGFNRGHATSYGELAYRSAYLKAHHPQEYFAALLDVFPKRARYIAAARGEGYRFLPPCVNTSGFGFSKGDERGTIRMGLAGIVGFGPVAVRTIVEGQPYRSVDDFRERLPASKVDASQFSILKELGAFSNLGLKGKRDDLSQVNLLGMTLGQPRELKGIKPKHVKKWTSNSGWRHDGLTSSVLPTTGKKSVSKLFWIPPFDEEKKGAFELKATPWAHVKTYLLTVIDENGIPFTLMANEDKPEEAKMLELLYEYAGDAVICAQGRIRAPFDTDGPMGFGFYGIAGADEREPQIWNYDDDDIPAKLTALAKAKAANRRRG